MPMDYTRTIIREKVWYIDDEYQIQEGERIVKKIVSYDTRMLDRYGATMHNRVFSNKEEARAVLSDAKLTILEHYKLVITEAKKDIERKRKRVEEAEQAVKLLEGSGTLDDCAGG